MFSKTKSPNYRPNVVRGAEHEQDGNHEILTEDLGKRKLNGRLVTRRLNEE
jgi:hypothetical protein